MLYQPPFVPGATPAVPGIFNEDADASYINGDPSAGTEGSYFPNAAIEHPQREIIKALTSAGITPDVAVLEQLAEAQARYASGGIWASCSGAANTYTLAKTGAFVVPKALFDGMMVEAVIPATNTGATTANVFGLGSKNVLTYGGDALAGGELVAARHTVWLYDPNADGGTGAWLILPWANAAEIVDVDSLPTLVRAVPAVGVTATGSETTIVSGVQTVMADWPNVQIQLVDSTFNATTGRLTIGAADAGIWTIIGGGNTYTGTAATGYDGTKVVINGAIAAFAQVSTDNLTWGQTAFTASWAGQLAEGDTVDIALDQTSGSDLPVQSATSIFAAWRVGA